MQAVLGSSPPYFLQLACSNLPVIVLCVQRTKGFVLEAVVPLTRSQITWPLGHQPSLTSAAR